MFGDNNIQALQTLVGKVDWIVCHDNLRDGIDVAFRVNGELKGFSINPDERFRVYDAPQPRNLPHGLLLESLPRERVLSLVSYCERYRENADLLTEGEASELMTIVEASQRQAAAAEAKRKEAERAHKERELERLTRELAKE
jgi:hypothetical protein